MPNVGISQMGALRVADPKEFERRLRLAMKAADGRLPDAAEELGVSARQLSRWLAEFPEVDRAPAHRPKVPRCPACGEGPYTETITATRHARVCEGCGHKWTKRELANE
jgi:hypothetical protein